MQGTRLLDQFPPQAQLNPSSLSPFAVRSTLNFLHPMAKSLSVQFTSYVQPNIILPYPFQVQHGGAFTSLTSGNSGTIDVTHFSGGVIMRAITGAISWISSFFSGRGIVSTISF